MTLKQKINDALFYIEPKISLIKCEKIVDEFAIEFSEWVNSLYVATDHKNKTYKELLEIYKKEKGL